MSAWWTSLASWHFLCAMSFTLFDSLYIFRYVSMCPFFKSATLLRLHGIHKFCAFGAALPRFFWGGFLVRKWASRLRNCCSCRKKTTEELAEASLKKCMAHTVTDIHHVRDIGILLTILLGCCMHKYFLWPLSLQKCSNASKFAANIEEPLFLWLPGTGRRSGASCNGLVWQMSAVTKFKKSLL